MHLSNQGLQMSVNYPPYPPYLYLCQAVDHAPEAMRTYLLIWREFHNVKTIDNILIFERETVENIHFIDWNHFIFDLRELAYEGLLEFMKVNEDKYTVILAQDCTECEDINMYGRTIC